MKSRMACVMLLCAVACQGEERIVPPTVILRLSLPAGVNPADAECLDLLLTSPAAREPTFFSFGANPSFLSVRNLDLDNDPDGIEETTSIRLLKGAVPFATGESLFLMTPGSGTGDSTVALTVQATARRANGTSSQDPCAGGTALAEGSADRDTRGQAIRFPASGNVLVDLPLACALSGGCSFDGGALPADGGVDGGAAVGDGGTDGGVADGGVAPDGGDGG